MFTKKNGVKDMTLTRIKVKQTNNKIKIIDKQTEIVDTNPVVYHGNEELPITDDDLAYGRVTPIARGLDEFKEYLKKSEHSKANDSKVDEVEQPCNQPDTVGKLELENI